MKLNIYPLLFLLTIVFNYSCYTNRDNNKELLSQFKDVFDLYHIPFNLKEDSIYNKIYDLSIKDNYLFAYDYAANILFSLTDIYQGNMIARFGKIGQGPTEISSPPTSLIIYQDTMYFFDINKSTLYFIDYKKDILYKPQKKFTIDRNKRIMRISI